MLKTKSVRTAIDRDADGLRILVARFRGHGVPKSRYDVWMPSVGPSERLLRRLQSGAISWARFAKEYRDELFLDGPIDRRSRTIKNHGQKFTLRLIERLAQRGNVTLLCHCAEDEQRCHRHILRALILGTRVPRAGETEERR
jgi:uncharacterized protein YeaO (DUF488 family)